MKKTHLREFSNMRVAIDALSWLHIGLFSQHPEIQNSEFGIFGYLVYPIRMLKLLQYYSITPIFVFDGKHLSNKDDTAEKRHFTREHNQHIAESLIKEGQYEAAQKYFVRAQAVTREMVTAFIDLVRATSFQVIVAPGEADPQLVYLLETGQVDYVISEDSDVIAFGGKKVLFKLKTNGCCSLFEHARLNSGLSADYTLLGRFPRFKLVLTCVLSGCDYVDSLKGVGPKTALELVWKCDSLKKLWKAVAFMPKLKGQVNEAYKIKVEQAVRAFLYYPVYDGGRNEVCPLSGEATEVEPLEPFHLPVSDLRRYVSGLVDIFTHRDRTEFADTELLLKMYRKFKIPKYHQANISFEFRTPTLKRNRTQMTADFPPEPIAADTPVELTPVAFSQTSIVGGKKPKLTASVADRSSVDIYQALLQRLALEYEGELPSDEENLRPSDELPSQELPDLGQPSEVSEDFENPFKAEAKGKLFSPKFEILTQSRGKQLEEKPVVKAGQMTLEESFKTPSKRRK